MRSPDCAGLTARRSCGCGAKSFPRSDAPSAKDRKAAAAGQNRLCHNLAAISPRVVMALNCLDSPLKFADNLPFIYAVHAQPDRQRPVALRKPVLMDNDWLVMARGWSICRGLLP